MKILEQLGLDKVEMKQPVAEDEDEPLTEYKEEAKKDDEEGAEETEQEAASEESASEEAAEEEEDSEEAASEEAAEEEAQKDDRIPKAVFLEEKSQRRHYQQLVEGQNETIRQLNEKLEALAKKLSPEEEINKDDDPIAYLDSRAEKTQKTIEELREELHREREEGRAKSFQTQIQTLESDFASKHADYWDALEHLKGSRIEELSLMGLSEDKITETIMGEYATLVTGALKNGKNPAEVAYNLSQKRGYKAKEEKPDEKKTLKSLSKKQEASGSLSSETGKSSKDELTPEDALDLSPEEFNKKFGGPEGQKRWAQLWQ